MLSPNRGYFGQRPLRASLGLTLSSLLVIESYVHNGRVGVLVELSAESDYGTRTDEFKSLARDIAMHITAMAPESLSALFEQPFIKEPSVTIGALLGSVSSTLQERISVTRFVRWDNTPRSPLQPGPTRTPALPMRGQSHT